MHKFPFIEEIRPEKGEGWSFVPADKLLEVCAALKDEGFDCLSCLTGVDRNDHFEVVYHIFSYSEKETVILKVNVAKDSLNVPSISSIWPSANWMEREAYDLFGIKFEGHPELKRLLLPDDWVGHPLRKDYKEGNEYQAMSTRR